MRITDRSSGAAIVVSLGVLATVLAWALGILWLMSTVGAGIGWGQINISTQTYGTLPNARVGGPWRAVGSGALASRPATCQQDRDIYICNGAGCTAGQNLHYCTAANTWTVQGQAAGGGITSLNGLNGAAQTLTKTDDTNVTLAIVDSGTDHKFNLGWTGTLAKARQNAQTAYLDVSQVFAAGQTIQASATDLLTLSNSGATNYVQLVTNKDRVRVWDSAPGQLAEFEASNFFGSGAGLSAGTVPTASLVEGANLPTSGQKAALAGSSGAPGAGNTYVTDADSRMTNARTPTAHAASHQHGGSDQISTATPGANAIPKSGAGGTLAVGWLGTGTPDGTKFLRDDGVFAAPPGGGGGTWGSITGTLSSQTDLNTALNARATRIVVTQAIDFPSLVAGQCSSFTDVTVTGAAVGDLVAVGPPTTVYDNPGLYLVAVARATNTVSVSLCNSGGQTINLASANFKVAVLQ